MLNKKMVKKLWKLKQKRHVARVELISFSSIQMRNLLTQM